MERETPLPCEQNEDVGSSINSDFFVNSFTMVVYENFF